jgi:hypothetical protein
MKSTWIAMELYHIRYYLPRRDLGAYPATAKLLKLPGSAVHLKMLNYHRYIGLRGKTGY